MLEIVDPLPSAQSKRRADTVYHALKRAILLRERQAGDALLEQDVANEMNCSQGTVREALLLLQHDGLVTRRGYRGTVVSHTSADEAALLARVRIDIEVNAAARAVAAASYADYEALHAVVAAMAEHETVGDTYALSELDHRFHGTIIRMASLEAVEPILTRCMLHMHRHTVGNPQRQQLGNENASEEHAALLRELESRDTGRAQAAARHHIEGVIRRWSPDVWKIMKPSADADA